MQKQSRKKIKSRKKENTASRRPKKQQGRNGPRAVSDLGGESEDRFPARATPGRSLHCRGGQVSPEDVAAEPRGDSGRSREGGGREEGSWRKRKRGRSDAFAPTRGAPCRRCQVLDFAALALFRYFGTFERICRQGWQQNPNHG